MIKSLNGFWDYRIGYGTWAPIKVPFCALAVGHSECKRSFDLEYKSETVLLKFDGITYGAEVYLNGEFIGVGVVELTDSIKKIIVITFGDIVDNIVRNFKNIDFDGVDTLICCSHATRGKKVFNYFHNMIGKIDLNVTQVIPIHKNFLCGHNQNLENEKTAEFIIKLLEM